ncbi:MAG: globin domain-containing protein [Pseudomonadota bacterium]
MDLTREDIDRIRESYHRVSADSQRAGEVFYDYLFEKAPETRALFLADMQTQAAKLTNTLGTIVAELQSFGTMAPLVEDLALRHVAYGVLPEHYDAVGAALLEMLERVTPGGLDPTTRAAWEAAYAALSGTMIDYAYDRAVSPLGARRMGDGAERL